MLATWRFALALQWLAVLTIALTITGCGTQGVASVGGTTRASMEAALNLESDCIQYRVAVDTAGVETWNADYVYFYLLDNDDRPMKNGKGEFVGQGLLHSQLVEFMSRNPQYGNDAMLASLVMRQVQRTKDGVVLSTSPPDTVYGVDLDSLLALAGR